MTAHEWPTLDISKNNWLIQVTSVHFGYILCGNYNGNHFSNFPILYGQNVFILFIYYNLFIQGCLFNKIVLSQGPVIKMLYIQDNNSNNDNINRMLRGDVLHDGN